MSVWLCIPSARPGGGTIRQWVEAGYKVACWIDPGAEVPRLMPNAPMPLPSIVHQDEYPGYAQAVNALARQVLRAHPDVQWIVTGGDDVEPDPNHTPDQIARECSAHFGGTFGVMQPTGDRYALGSIDRIAGSPWMGREWCLRANGGRGPLWPEFDHMFVDEHLMEFASALGVYWPRRDLVQLHRHYMREDESLNSRAVGKPVPTHLQKWAGRGHWDRSKAILSRLKAEGFASCEPTPVDSAATL